MLSVKYFAQTLWSNTRNKVPLQHYLKICHLNSVCCISNLFRGKLNAILTSYYIIQVITSPACTCVCDKSLCQSWRRIFPVFLSIKSHFVDNPSFNMILTSTMSLTSCPCKLRPRRSVTVFPRGYHPLWKWYQIPSQLTPFFQKHCLFSCICVQSNIRNQAVSVTSEKLKLPSPKSTARKSCCCCCLEVNPPKNQSS